MKSLNFICLVISIALLGLVNSVVAPPPPAPPAPPPPACGYAKGAASFDGSTCILAGIYSSQGQNENGVASPLWPSHSITNPAVTLTYASLPPDSTGRITHSGLTCSGAPCVSLTHRAAALTWPKPLTAWEIQNFYSDTRPLPQVTQSVQGSYAISASRVEYTDPYWTITPIPCERLTLEDRDGLLPPPTRSVMANEDSVTPALRVDHATFTGIGPIHLSIPARIDARSDDVAGPPVDVPVAQHPVCHPACPSNAVCVL